jgi:hypothetical protein
MNSKIYNAIVNVGDVSIGNNGYIKYRKISHLERFKSFLGSKYPLWVFATVYDHETKEKIEVIKPGKNNRIK